MRRALVWAAAALCAAGGAEGRAEGGAGLAASAKPVEEAEKALCAALAQEVGPAALGAAGMAANWNVFEALETVSCSYVFVDAGRAAPAGHHVAARWGNHELIDWIGWEAKRRGDPALAARIFLREGAEGTALDYLDKMVAQFAEEEPEMSALFQEARDAMARALE